MRISRTLTALGAFFVLALAVAGCGGGIPGNSVAVVAGNPITTQAFDHWMYVAAKGNASQSPGSPVIVPNDPPRFSGCLKQVRAQIPSLAKTPDKEIRSDCSQLFKSLSGQVMDFLIKAYWYQAQAYKLGVRPSNAKLDKIFAQDKKQQFPTASQFKLFLSQTGQTIQDIRFRVRVNEIYKELLARQTPKVTPATIAAYYNAHKSQFGSPASRDLRIVRTNSQSKAQAALSALRSGQSWKTVAKQYSVDTTTKNQGGLLTGVTKGEEEQALDKAAFAAPKNKLEGPIHGTFGWYVLEVVKITPSTSRSLAQSTLVIKQLLNSQNQSAASRKVDQAAKKAWGAKTKCRAAFAMADCAGYKPPKTTSTTTPSGSPPTTTSTPTTTTSSGGTKKK